MEVLFIALLFITVLLNFFFIQKHVSGMIMLLLAFIVISILVTWTEQESKERWTAFFAIVYGYFLAGNGIIQSIRNKKRSYSCTPNFLFILCEK